jgi:hypothetical protein
MGTAINQGAIKGLAHVDASLNYLAEMAERPFIYICQPPPGKPARNSERARHRMPVYDGRAIAAQLTLDRNGFALVRHETRVADFYNDDEVRSVYYPEVERLVKEVTGAARVLCFDHNVRCGPTAKRGEKGVREPVDFAHNDYTFKSAPQRVRDLMPDEAEELLKNRYAFINVWRPIKGPVMDTPLGVCDAESIVERDFKETDLIYSDRIGEIYLVTFSANHRWFYFPRMERNEALLLKCFDSAGDGRARFTAHSAFEDPACPPGAPARESIEARTVAFFAP